MTKVTYEAFAYLPEYRQLSDIASGKVLPHITERQEDSYYAEQGYPMIGSVKVTLTLNGQDKIVQNQIKALNKNLQNERAESKQRQNAILDQISKLQALTFSGVTA